MPRREEIPTPCKRLRSTLHSRIAGWRSMGRCATLLSLCRFILVECNPSCLKQARMPPLTGTPSTAKTQLRKSPHMLWLATLLLPSERTLRGKGTFILLFHICFMARRRSILWLACIFSSGSHAQSSSLVHSLHMSSIGPLSISLLRFQLCSCGWQLRHVLVQWLAQPNHEVFWKGRH